MVVGWPWASRSWSCCISLADPHAVLLGGILAYILNPLVGWLRAPRRHRTIGAVVAIALIAGLVVLFVLIVVPLFTKEIRLLIERLPGVLEQVGTRSRPGCASASGIELSSTRERARLLRRRV